MIFSSISILNVLELPYFHVIHNAFNHSYNLNEVRFAQDFYSTSSEISSPESHQTMLSIGYHKDGYFARDNMILPWACKVSWVGGWVFPKKDGKRPRHKNVKMANKPTPRSPLTHPPHPYHLNGSIRVF